MTLLGEWQMTEFERAVLTALERLASRLCEISEKEEQLMSTLQDVLDALAVEDTDIGKLTAFISSLESQISAVPGLTSAQQAQIDTIFSDVNKDTATIVTAMQPVTPSASGTFAPVPPIVLPPIVAPGTPAPAVAPAFTGNPPPPANPTK